MPSRVSTSRPNDSLASLSTASLNPTVAGDPAEFHMGTLVTQFPQKIHYTTHMWVLSVDLGSHQCTPHHGDPVRPGTPETLTLHVSLIFQLW